ncbi:hypothetical protein EBZ37_15210 [bacterium]|nr:hypothetical protein [bacterium]
MDSKKCSQVGSKSTPSKVLSLLSFLAMAVGMSACSIDQEARNSCRLTYEGAQERACFQGVSAAALASSEMRGDGTVATFIANANSLCDDQFRQDSEQMRSACRRGIEYARLAYDRQVNEARNPHGPRW